MTDSGASPGYPVQWEADVVLRDGSVAHVRPILPSDVAEIQRFHERQSEESVYLRFFAPLRTLSDRDATRFATVDHRDRVALVATMRDEIIGVGRYDRIDAHVAEVAFNVSDHHQGRGIGSVMLEHLAAIAREQDIRAFEAEVLPQNRKMLGVFADAGYEVSRRVEDGVVLVRFDIEPTEQSAAVRVAREHRAEALSMRSLLFPSSIAVVGVSRRPDSIGHQILRHILEAEFTGPVHAVNPAADEVLGLTAQRRVGDIPTPPDLAVVAVPAAAVLDVVEDCATAGVKSLLVLSSGFAEVGPEGEERQAALLRATRGSGMRIVGPNSFGLMNTRGDVRLNATLAPTLPPEGHLGLFSQSGALGIAILDSASRRNLGVSVFASAGNRVDVSGNDFMQYWIDDESTHAVGLYLESMGNPRKFSRIARRLASVKPVIVVKSRVSAFGVPPGHRVAATRARPEAFEAMLGQAGVIHVENAHQLFDIAQLVVHQPLPTGPRVAIVGNSAQLSALTADSCLGWGLEVAHGPVSVRTEATVAEFRAALTDAFTADVDSVLICFVPPLASADEEILDAIRETAADSGTPCAATLLGMRGVDPRADSVDVPAREGSDRPPRAVPLYAMPEDAVRAVASATRYGQWRAKDRGVQVAPVGIDRNAAYRLVDEILHDYPEGRALTEGESTALLAAYGVHLWPRIEVGTAEEAVVAAREVGLPVVVKSLSPVARSRAVDGIRVDLRTETAVRVAFESLDERLAPIDANHFVVQRMAHSGVACVIGADEDPLFGPVMSFSIAGPPTELLGDIGYRIPPLTDVDVPELIASVRAAPLLRGHRGSAPVDMGALSDVVARISVLADDLPQLARLVINPALAHTGGVDVLGAEVYIAPAPRRQDPGRRALT